MNKRFNLSVTILAMSLVAIMVGCKKETPLTVPEEQAHFTNMSSGSYQITAPGVTYKIPVGLTTVSNAPRTVNITVASPTGAVQGTHYTLNKTSFVIPAGQVLDTLVVSGNFAQYNAGRRDTLVFTISGTDKGGVAASTYNNVFKLAMRGPCFEGEIATSIQDLVGDYNNTLETGYNNTTGAVSYNYGPYKTTIKSITPTSATTANIVVAGLYDPSWNDLTFTLDWTNINDRRITLAAQLAGDAGTVNSAYAGMQLSVNPLVSANPAPAYGTFSYCNQTLTLKFRMCIPSLGGCFGTQVVEVLKR